MKSENGNEIVARICCLPFLVCVQRRGEIVLRESVETPGDGRILVLPDKPVQPAGEVPRRHPFFVLGKRLELALVSGSVNLCSACLISLSSYFIHEQKLRLSSFSDVLKI